MATKTVIEKKKVERITNEITKELTETGSIDITKVNITELTAITNEYDIQQFDDEEHKTIRSILPTLTSKNGDQAFSIIDMGAIFRRCGVWRAELPNVEPFYAVKCNSDELILKTLASLGVGFDVASKGEISMVTELGIKRDKIIYANPCKGLDHIQFARSQSIQMMTFDNVDELLKIKLFHPNAQLVLRILVDDSKSKMPFGSKFGCPMDDVENVLKFAIYHELNVIGVSFHVGSGCMDASAYSEAIIRAKEVFDIAKNDNIGYVFHLLDIGGGFPGVDVEGEISFKEIAKIINEQLEISFNDIENLRIIAEPGRFFATSALTMVTSVTGKKKITEKDGNIIYHYYVNSSLYGMFNNQIFDKGNPQFKLLNDYNDNDDKTYKSVIFGETCDSMDKLAIGIELPVLAYGDYIYVENHGAYTLASASDFNGFKVPKVYYIFTY